MTSLPEPLTVAMSLLPLAPGRAGGSESYLRGLVGALADRETEVRVVLLAGRAVAPAYAGLARGAVELRTVRGVRVAGGGAGRAAGLAAAGLRRRRLGRAIPAEAAVLHHPLTLPLPAAAIPTVVTLHDVQHHEHPEFFSAFERRFRARAYDDAARSAAAVIVPTEHARAAAIRHLGIDPNRIVASHLAVDHRRFTPEPPDADARALAALDLPARYVLYPANLWPHKNHARLVEALGRTADRELALVLTGRDMGRLGELRQAARRAGVEERVRHLGYVGSDAVAPLHRRARALAFPSLYEGFGQPPLEAMACGCPVACSDRGSLPEVVGGAAVMFDPDDPAAIAAAIDRVVDDEPLRERLVAAGLERARGFTWAAAAERHLRVYERVAQRRASHV